MFTPITFPTALYFWLSYNNKKELPQLDSSVHIQETSSFQKDRFLFEIQDFNLYPPFHILVPSATLRNRGQHFRCHVMPKKLPKNSFRMLTDSLSIICPELCFLLAAPYLTVQELAALACDLCGIYAYDETSDYGQSSRNQITSVKKISDYLNKAHNIKGITKAKKAISHALDRSNSPMESKLAVTAILPYRLGGFSLERPDLNLYIDLNKDSSSLVRQEYLCCDMCWPDKKLIIEYDSKLTHLSNNQFYYDKRRSSALGFQDYNVLHVTWEYFRNHKTVEDLFLLIGNKLNKRIPQKNYAAGREQRNELIQKFFLTDNSLDWFHMFK